MLSTRKLLPLLAFVALGGCGKVAATAEEASGDEPVAVPEAPLVPSVPTPPRRKGYINTTTTGGGFSASADFPIASEQVRPARSAECELVVDPGPEKGTAVPAKSANAGTILIDVPARDRPMTATLAFDPSTSTYESVSLSGAKGARPDNANAPIHIRAAGADVPAFDVDVLSAFDAALIEPAEGATISVDSGDLVVAWSDAGNEAMVVVLVGPEAYVYCSFRPAAGQGVMPAALVQKVLLAYARPCPLGCARSLPPKVVLGSFRGSQVSSGDYDISVQHALWSERTLRFE